MHINAWIIDRFNYIPTYNPATEEVMWDYEYIGKGQMAFGFNDMSDADLVEFKMRFG